MAVRSNKNSWTPEEDIWLVILLNQYLYDYSSLADELGRSEVAIKKRIHKLKLRQRPVPSAWSRWSQAELAKMFQMRQEGKPWHEIGRELQRNVYACQSAYKRQKKAKGGTEG